MAECEQKISPLKLDCSICLFPFKDPKLLPCFHTFCVECLEEYVRRTGQGGQFECPLCRTVTEIPTGGVRTFQSNFYIQVEELLKVVVDCDVCGNVQKSTHYCIECEEHFCERCVTTHSKMKMTREHRLLLLNTAKVSPDESFSRKVQKKSYCPHHNGEEIKMICKDCDTLLCIVCKLTEHENHCSLGIAKEAAERQSSLSKKIANAKGTHETLHSDIEKAKSCANEAKNKLKKSTSEIDKHVEIVVANIRKEADQMKRKLVASNADIQDYYTEKQNLLKDKISERDAVINYAENVLKVGDDLQVLDTKLLEKIESLEDPLENMVVQNYHYVAFKASDITDMSHHIGNIVTPESKSVIKLSKQRVGACLIGATTQANVISICADVLYMGFLDYGGLICYNTNTDTSRTLEYRSLIPGSCSGMYCINGSTCFFSCLPDKSVYKVNLGDRVGLQFHVFDGYPHGMSYKQSSNELLVCVLRDVCTSKMFEITTTTGCVMALPMAENKNNCMYNWRAEETPGPTCIAVNEADGTVCLGYPTGRKVTLNAPDGTRLSEFSGIGGYGSPVKFCPVSVCFDNECGIIIADHGNDALIRISESGVFLQLIVKRKRPLSVACGDNQMLFVGSMNEDICVYALTFHECP